MNRLTLLAGAFLLAALPASAQETVVLTLEDALERARASAPALITARLRIEEARTRLLGASLPLAANTSIELEAGPRRGATRSTDYGVAIEQELDLPQRRRARIDVVNAGIRQEEARAGEAELELLREVAIAFVRALEARERASAAEAAKRLADEALSIADRRYEAGDVAQLDVNLARTAVARSNADLRAAHAALLGHTTTLQVLLGIREPVSVEGSLGTSLHSSAEELVRLASDRADIRRLDAEIAEAEAEQRLARTRRWPELGFRGSYAREEGDRIALAGIGFTLPLFDYGQEAMAATTARLDRLAGQRDALRRSIAAEVRGAVAAYEALRGAASDYEKTVMPLIEENERLALESYEVGQIGLADLLLVRREALESRRALIDQLAGTRLAEVELRARAGVWK